MLMHTLALLIAFTAVGQQAAPLPPPAPVVALTRLARPAATPSRVGRPRPTEEKPREIRIFRIEHADPLELSRVIRSVVDDVDLAVDGRTNSLIAAGSADALARIREILGRLDSRPTARLQEPITQLHSLRHLSATQAAERLIELFDTQHGRRGFVPIGIVPSDGAGTVLLRGPKDRVAEAAKLLADIDTPMRAAGSFFVQIYCLMDGETHGEDPIEPDAFPGAGDVLHELEALGLREPALIFRTLIRVGDHAEFEVTGETKEGRHVEISGTILQSDTVAANFELRFSLAAPRDSESDTPSNLQTTLHVPLGEQVIVGAAPHAGGATVVLVLRVDDTARRKPARSRSSTRSRRITPSSRGTRLDPSDPNAKTPPTRVLVPVDPSGDRVPRHPKG